jgi:hypothetical protein
MLQIPNRGQLYNDVSTLLNCYQQADKETLLEVMSHSRKIRDQVKTG